jgi:hypothetical protein
MNGEVITAERLREKLHYEPSIGVFKWRIARSKARVGAVAGTAGGNDGYRKIWIDGREYKESRLVWLYMTGEWPRTDIDHCNGDKADNRWANLREATGSQNKANTPMQANNSSGFKGVSWHKGKRKWQACISLNGKIKTLGRFASRERAFLEYCFAAWRNFGDYARIDADYLQAIKKRKMLQGVALYNLARPDYLT